jgi:hypothetical protein
MSKTIAVFNRDLEHDSVALVRLLDAAEIGIGILPYMPVVHSHTRTKRQDL